MAEMEARCDSRLAEVVGNVVAAMRAGSEPCLEDVHCQSDGDAGATCVDFACKCSAGYQLFGAGCTPSPTPSPTESPTPSPTPSPTLEPTLSPTPTESQEGGRAPDSTDIGC